MIKLILLFITDIVFFMFFRAA